MWSVFCPKNVTNATNSYDWFTQTINLTDRQTLTLTDRQTDIFDSQLQCEIDRQRVKYAIEYKIYYVAIRGKMRENKYNIRITIGIIAR